jgi:predicted TIM-barrel fold metal-dependent hydrolase
VDLAVAEVHRAKGLGLSAVMIPLHIEPTDSYGDPRLDPLWEAAAANDMPVNIHTATTRLQSRAWKGTTLPGTASDGVLASPTEIQRHLLDITFAGVFDRVPDLRVVSAELDAGWAAFMLQRADNWFGRNRKLKASDAVRCTRPPSEYFSSNIRVTFQDDPAAMRTADLLGDDVLMWGSDFPHHSSTWPHSEEVIESQLGDQPFEVRDRLVRSNAAALYGF